MQLTLVVRAGTDKLMAEIGKILGRAIKRKELNHENIRRTLSAQKVIQGT